LLAVCSNLHTSYRATIAPRPDGGDIHYMTLAVLRTSLSKGTHTAAISGLFTGRAVKTSFPRVSPFVSLHSDCPATAESRTQCLPIRYRQKALLYDQTAVAFAAIFCLEASEKHNRGRCGTQAARVLACHIVFNVCRLSVDIGLLQWLRAWIRQTPEPNKCNRRCCPLINALMDTYYR